MIYKIDISRAFRQIKVDPGDIDLLGFKFENKYFLDLSVAFGYRNGSQIFYRCTDLRFIMSQHGFHHLHNYIDDLIYTGLPSEIHASYNFLQHLLSQLGLDISIKKVVPPVHQLRAWAFRQTLSKGQYPFHQANYRKLSICAKNGLPKHTVAKRTFSFSWIAFYILPSVWLPPDLSLTECFNYFDTMPMFQKIYLLNYFFKILHGLTHF